MTRKELYELAKKAGSTMPYYLKSVERDAILFTWKSNTEGFEVPVQPEILVTSEGALGWDKKNKVWVVGSPTGMYDKLGDIQSFVCRTLDNTDMQGYTLQNHTEVIMCGNTPLYRSFDAERTFYSNLKHETDVSIRSQLILSRISKAIVAENDPKAKQIREAFKDIEEGKILVLTTSLMEELDVLELTDPDDIEKMQYLSSFYQSVEKREANDFGIDLELIDKRAQVTSNEIKQYDDVTTLEYLIMFESRQRFVKEMKENGFDIEITRNPIFFDEPTKEDVEEGKFEEAKAGDDEGNPGEGNPGDDEGKGGNENGDDEN